ncbi:hypothetical protein SAQ01S_11250 [Sphingomonas aquatilis NBRC 16722]|uniref:Uncharacterized protein n=1 Tax=Sphingomonas aquatilis TaxID=93063 RepID=A0AAW3TWR6_9SPHN|nr:hypothetical protein [Sphingomonas aquatilis]MBB3875879.1 hypothetical protein [Sphingomonas aquatilis]GEM71359.1 hypothetical protein SAQ01S_11250 [Sphingomonas aquatilis NBRC 16722]
MDETTLEPGTRVRSKFRRLKQGSATDPLGNTAAIEASLPDDPRSDDGLTPRAYLETTRERLRRQVAEDPDSVGDRWTALPSGHLHVFAWERGKILDDFVVENDPVGIKHGTLKAALMQTLGIRAEGEGPFNSRMRTFLQLGLFGPVGVQRDRRNYGYALSSALKWAIAMTLQRAYVPPSAVVDFLSRHDHDLYALFRQLRRGDGPPLRLRISVEALQALGDEERSKGRGSRGGDTGTLHMNGPTHQPFDAAASAPMLDIDLRELGNKLIANLIEAGVSKVRITRAQRILPDLSARPMPSPSPSPLPARS